jgi:hypothetical protein
MKRFFLLLLFPVLVVAQSTRINDYNPIGWIGYNGTFQVSEKIGIHTEYQWRRTEFIENWQQSLLRVGVNYKLTPEITARAGYAWAETFAYGDIPLNGFGKKFTEHRAYEMLQINTKVKPFDLSHRLMLEQRWIGRYLSAESTSEDDFLYMNRVRYMIRWQLPLAKSRDRVPYLAIYDEIFVGFGNNVGENIFDQNRLGVLIGCPVNKTLRVEGGYLNQIVQYGREIDGRNVFQHNNGFILTGIFNFDLQKKNVEP